MNDMRLYVLNGGGYPSRRLTENSSAPPPFGLLFTVIGTESNSGRRSPRALLEQASNASQIAHHASKATGLPVALATNLHLDAPTMGFHWQVSIGKRWNGKPTGINVWRDRLAAIAASPFELCALPIKIPCKLPHSRHLEPLKLTCCVAVLITVRVRLRGLSQHALARQLGNGLRR